MTFSSEPLILAGWITGMIAQGSVFALLIGRKSYREYPAFSSFIAFCVARSLLLFFLAHHAQQYYQPVLWVTYAPMLIVLVAIVREVFYILFHPYDTLPQRTLAHFGQATVAVIVAAVAFAFRFPGAQPTAWMTLARAMDQVVSWVLCAVFGFIVLFATYFGIPWRHRLFGIGIGFLFYMSVDVAVTTVVAQYGLPSYSWISLIDIIAFIAACGVWCYYFATPEVPRSVPTLEQLRKIQLLLRRTAITVGCVQQSVSGHVLQPTSSREEELGGTCD